ncbi:MAG: hypothetical protein KJ077_10920 [Anaerolineae bacterium]|nr:hypothetical protein [Anaerolineae bacterium]
MAKKKTTSQLVPATEPPQPQPFTLVGKRVHLVRAASKEELEALGLDDFMGGLVIIQFNDGTLLFALADEEGNGPGSLQGQTPDERALYLFPKDGQVEYWIHPAEVQDEA